MPAIVAARLSLPVVSDIGAPVTSSSVAGNEIATDQTEESGSWQVSHHAELGTHAFPRDVLEYCVDGSDPCEEAIASDTELMIIHPVNAGDANGDEVVNVLAILLTAQRWAQTGCLGRVPEYVTKGGAISVLDMIIIGQHCTG